MNGETVREIITDRVTICSAQPVPALLEEMKRLARSGDFRFFLAHADDGVIWGRVENGLIITAPGFAPQEQVKLRQETLQEARIFGEQAEVYFWRTETGWQSREIRDGVGEETEHYDENWLLWGTDPDGDAAHGFYPVKEADTGIRHAPPARFIQRHTLRLHTRHYLGYDERGAVYVCASRLAGVANQFPSIAGRQAEATDGG